jgi:4-amino-4-deoxy-L-arabinose transferase-like glycosyltransferase
MNRPGRPGVRASPEWLVFVLCFGVQLLILSRFAASPFFLPESDDMQFYNEWGKRVLQGRFTDYQAFYGLPGYAFVLAAIYFVAGYNPFAVGLIQAALSALVAVLLIRIARKCFSKTTLGSESESSAAIVIGVAAGLSWMLFQPAQCFS